MINIIIAENLINDYCGQHNQFVQQNVHIGRRTMDTLIGKNEQYGFGPIPLFLKNQIQQKNTHLIFFRDSYKLEDQMQQEHLERLGEHCIQGTPGEKFPDIFHSVVSKSTVLDCASLSFPLKPFQEFMIRHTGLDPVNAPEKNSLANIRFLLMGFHTERRVLATANTLRNLFQFPQVAVFSHFLASFNKEQHFTSLRYQYPDSLIQVLNNVSELESYLQGDLSCLHPFHLAGGQYQPQIHQGSVDS